MQLSLAELGPRIGAEVRGDGALCVTGVAELSAGHARASSRFYSNGKYKKDPGRPPARGAVIVAEADEALGARRPRRG